MAAAALSGESKRLAAIVRRFPEVRLLVVGDVMLDQFIWGRVSRISPEAPVPVVQVTRESFHLGGAANVAANIRALGGRASIVGVIGGDAHGARILRELRAIRVGVSGLLRASTFATIRKTRILAHQQQVVRLDREPGGIGKRLSAQVVGRVMDVLDGFDGIVVSDYNKGVIGPDLLSRLAARPKGAPMLFIDPKKDNFPHYAGATLVKPNLEAAQAATGIVIGDTPSLERAGKQLIERWRSQAVLISRGEEGMTLFRSNQTMHHFPTTAREVFDVTGAGDTVLATAALALGAGSTFEEAAVLANRAAGIVVGKIGTATASGNELAAEISRASGA